LVSTTRHGREIHADGWPDRRSVWWDITKPLNPADWRHATRPGDFELETLAVEDALVTVYQPGGQRPYNVSVFNAAIGPLRKRWLFYDIISAEGITGQFDNCLFSLHMPQKLGKVQGDEGRLIKRMVRTSSLHPFQSWWLTPQARFRIDGLPIEHAQYATGHTGPMSWITSGKLDAVLDIKFPYHPDEQVDFKAIFEEIGRNVVTISHGAHPDVDHEQQHAHSSNTKETVDAAIEASAAAEATSGAINPGQHRLARPPLRAPDASRTWMSQRESQGQERREVTVDIDLRFRDLKAAVPMFTSDLSVTNNALIRPIVAFIK
jgi:distribution and morphology protein 31